MANYEFECGKCKKEFTVSMRISERDTASVECPACGSREVQPVMQTFFARTGRKS
jgi:putative FmdB family regulatory protein